MTTQTATKLDDYQVMTPKEAAAYLGVGLSTLRRWKLAKVQRGPGGQRTGYWRKTIVAAATMVKGL